MEFDRPQYSRWPPSSGGGGGGGGADCRVSVMGLFVNGSNG